MKTTSSNYPAERLRAARELILDRTQWCQYKPTCIFEGEVQRCLMVALDDSRVGPEALRVLSATSRDLGWPGSSLSDFNDNHTHEEVIALLDETIDRLENGLEYTDELKFPPINWRSEL